MELAFAEGEEGVEGSYESPCTLLKTSIAIRLRKISHRGFYKRLQGIYKRFFRRIYMRRPKVVFGGLKVEK